MMTQIVEILDDYGVLRRTRDLLLLRLVSGALEVEGMPAATGTVAFPQEGMIDYA